MDITIIQKLEELFDHMESRTFSLHMMETIAKLANSVKEDFAFSMEIYERAAKNLVIAKQETDFRVLRYYLPVFKVVFMKAADWTGAMQYIYSMEHFKGSPEKLPAMRDQYPAKEFDIEVHKIVTNLLCPQPNLPCDDKQYNQLCREFSFYLTIGPKPAINSLMITGITACDPLVLDRLVEILRKIPPFTLRVPHVYLAPREELVILANFRFLICQNYRGSPRKLEALKYLATELTCTKHNGNEEIPPVIDANELVEDLISDLIERLKDNSVSILLEMLLTMLPRAEDGGKVWEIVWQKRKAPMENGIVDPYKLQNAIFDLYKREMSFKPLKSTVLAYKQLYNRLKSDQFPMTDFEEEVFVRFLIAEAEKERAEQEAKERAEKEAKERELAEQAERERIEREKREKEEQARREAEEREKERLEKVRQQKEQARLEKEQRDKERAEKRRQMEEAKREQEEKAERARIEKQQRELDEQQQILYRQQEEEKSRVSPPAQKDDDVPAQQPELATPEVVAKEIDGGQQEKAEESKNEDQVKKAAKTDRRSTKSPKVKRGPKKDKKDDQTAPAVNEEDQSATKEEKTTAENAVTENTVTDEQQLVDKCTEEGLNAASADVNIEAEHEEAVQLEQEQTVLPILEDQIKTVTKPQDVAPDGDKGKENDTEWTGDDGWTTDEKAQSTQGDNMSIKSSLNPDAPPFVISPQNREPLGPRGSFGRYPQSYRGGNTSVSPTPIIDQDRGRQQQRNRNYTQSVSDEPRVRRQLPIQEPQKQYPPPHQRPYGEQRPPPLLEGENSRPPPQGGYRGGQYADRGSEDGSRTGRFGGGRRQNTRFSSYSSFSGGGRANWSNAGIVDRSFASSGSGRQRRFDNSSSTVEGPRQDRQVRQAFRSGYRNRQPEQQQDHNEAEDNNSSTVEGDRDRPPRHVFRSLYRNLQSEEQHDHNKAEEK